MLWSRFYCTGEHTDALFGSLLGTDSFVQPLQKWPVFIA